MVTRFQQQLEEEFGKLQTEQATKEESQIEED
jgi:cell division protein FtsL